MRRWLPVCFFALAPWAWADDTDLLHVFLDLEVNPTTRVVTATVTHRVKAARNGLTTYTLRLYRGFTVNGVRVNGKSATYSRPTDGILVALDRTYRQGESFTVQVSYVGTPVSLGFGSFRFGTHGPNRAPVIWSLSEPWYAYSWWACKETLTDKFTADVWITVPAGLVAASNGVLQGVDSLPNNKKRYRWRTGYPMCTYAVCVNISDYRQRTDTYRHLGANMPVVFYGFPEQWSYQQAGMSQIVPMLTTFANLFGQYPFVREKYGIAQFGWGGAWSTRPSRPRAPSPRSS